MRTRPLNNNVLVEVLRDDSGVSRNDANESLKHGRLIGYSVNRFHITASSFGQLSENFMNDMRANLKQSVGGIVRWEEFAEGGQTFDGDNGETYALIPWWRLISYEEVEK